MRFTESVFGPLHSTYRTFDFLKNEAHFSNSEIFSTVLNPLLLASVNLIPMYVIKLKLANLESKIMTNALSQTSARNVTSLIVTFTAIALSNLAFRFFSELCEHTCQHQLSVKLLKKVDSDKNTSEIISAIKNVSDKFTEILFVSSIGLFSALYGAYSLNNIGKSGRNLALFGVLTYTSVNITYQYLFAKHHDESVKEHTTSEQSFYENPKDVDKRNTYLKDSGEEVRLHSLQHALKGFICDDMAPLLKLLTATILSNAQQFSDATFSSCLVGVKSISSFFTHHIEASRDVGKLNTALDTLSGTGIFR